MTPEIAIFSAFLLALAPRGLSMVGQFRRPEGFDFSNSRRQQAELAGIWRRAQAAHLNGLEAFAPFAAAVILAQLAGSEPGALVQFCIVFLALRLIFIVCYLLDLNPLRSLVWIAALITNLWIFGLAI